MAPAPALAAAAENPAVTPAAAAKTPAVPPESALTQGNRGEGLGWKTSGGEITVKADASFAGRTVYLVSYPPAAIIATATVSGTGSFTIAVPEGGTATYRIAVIADDGTVLGWREGAASGTRLEAEVIAPAEPQDGEFSFVAPADATVKLTANAELDDLGRSISTGTLGSFTVIDQRAKSQPGWDLIADATDFADVRGTTAGFAASALGIHVRTAAADGLTTTDTTAGSASYTAAIASRASGRYGDVAFDGADLTVTAPAGTPAGTYGGTLTLTLTSR